MVMDIQYIMLKNYCFNAKQKQTKKKPHKKNTQKKTHIIKPHLIALPREAWLHDTLPW